MLTKTLSQLSIISLLTGSILAAPATVTGDQKHLAAQATNTATPLEKKDIDVIIYSSKNCYYCHKVKDVFDEKKITYTEIDVDNNAQKLKEMEAKTGKATVPQVLINGKHVGSYLDIVWGDVDEILKDQVPATNK